MEELNSWIDKLRNVPVKEVDNLDLSEVWSDESVIIWKAKAVNNPSPFYPVYKYQDYYAPNILPLILLKKNFQKNASFWEAFKPKKKYQSGHPTVDSEITRVSGEFSSNLSITSEKEMINAVADAMIRDAQRMVELYPDHEHIVFCGGKDSLNILLLPWSKPIIVASAPPNFKLVKEFVAKNDLQVKDLVELNEEPSQYEEMEVLANNCLNDLAHCRWINHFVSLSEKYPKCIFWKGQLGDTFLTDNWKTYRVKRIKWKDRLKTIKRAHKDFIKSLWYRGAMWQGTHVSQIRMLTGRLVLSIYHGPAMTAVLKEMDLTKSVHRDLRDEIGNAILGKKVDYPKENPSPFPMKRLKQISHPDYFEKVLNKILN